ncbi:MAG: hypothetical protein ABFR82_00555 [Nitrospirota bacterium]
MIKKAEAILADDKISSIDIIIRAIKQINPTPHIHLSDKDKEQAYRIKSNLQNYLLGNYPDLFDLEPTEWDENIVLIRYKVTPLVDACHAKLHQLSRKVLAGLRKADSVKPARQKKKKVKSRSPDNINTDGIAGCIDKARLYLDTYDYDDATEVLADMEIDRKQDLPALLRGVSILREEIGAYGTALDILLSIPDDLMGDEVKEELANLYFLNNQLDDAKGLFEECNIYELKQESVYRYANLLHQKAESRAAYDMLELAERLDGHIDGIEALRRDINTVLITQAEPYLIRARSAFDQNSFEDSEAEVRNALSICPEYEDARDLLKVLLAIRSEDEVEALWKEYSGTSESSSRLTILKKLKIKDRQKGNEIDRLIKEAVEEEKRSQIFNTISEISRHLESGNNEAAFNRLFLLLKERVRNESLKSLGHEYPHIKAVLDNEDLLSLRQSKARDAWLSYIELTNISITGEMNRAEQLLKNAFAGFHNDTSYQKIKNMFDETARGIARKRVKDLFGQLESDDMNIDNAEKLYSLIRKESSVLSQHENKRNRMRCEEILKKLRHEYSVETSRKKYRDYCKQMEKDDISLNRAEKIMEMIKKESVYISKEEFKKNDKKLKAIMSKLQQASYIESLRKSLLYGDNERADMYRDMIQDRAAVLNVEKELASLYSVEGVPINVVVNSDINEAFSRKSAKDFDFISIKGDEVFFDISIDNTNWLIIFNIENTNAWKYRLNNFHYKFKKVIHADSIQKIYHFLCEDTDDEFHYIRVILKGENSSVLAQLDLSDVLHLEENSYFEDGLFLTDDHRYLYVIYLPDEDEWDDRRLAAIDLYEGTISKQRKVKSMGESYAVLPVSPPRLMLGDDNIILFDEKLKKVNKVHVSKDRGSIDQILIDEQKRLLYIFKVTGKNDALLFAIMNFEFNIVEYHENIAPEYDFSFREKYYDSSRDVIYLHNMFYDYRKKQVIKDFGEDKFSEEDFIFSPESMDKLVQAIKDDGFDITSETKEVSNLDYLNVIISLPNLYEQISREKKEIQLSRDLLKSAEEIKDLLVKSHDEIKDYEWWKIRKFNRDLLEISYPELVPKVRSLSDYCFFIRPNTKQYMICDYIQDTNKIILTDICPYIDKLIDYYKKT